MFHRFRQAEFDKSGSIFSLSQFLLLPQLPQKNNEACFKSGQNRCKKSGCLQRSKSMKITVAIIPYVSEILTNLNWPWKLDFVVESQFLPQPPNSILLNSIWKWSKVNRKTSSHKSKYVSHTVEDSGMENSSKLETILQKEISSFLDFENYY